VHALKFKYPLCYLYTATSVKKAGPCALSIASKLWPGVHNGSSYSFLPSNFEEGISDSETAPTVVTDKQEISDHL